MVLVDDASHIGSHAHCHGGTALACPSHEAEVACVVVDDDPEVGHVGRHYGQEPVPLARRLCANELVDVHDNSRRTDESENPAVRAAAMMCTSVSLCVEHSEAARGAFELKDAMKLFLYGPSCRPRLAFEAASSDSGALVCRRCFHTVSCGGGGSATSTLACLQHGVPFSCGRCGHNRKRYLSSSAQ